MVLPKIIQNILTSQDSMEQQSYPLAGVHARKETETINKYLNKTGVVWWEKWGSVKASLRDVMAPGQRLVAKKAAVMSD